MIGKKIKGFGEIWETILKEDKDYHYVLVLFRSKEHICYIRQDTEETYILPMFKFERIYEMEQNSEALIESQRKQLAFEIAETYLDKTT